MNIVLHVPICRNGSMFVMTPRGPQTLGDSWVGTHSMENIDNQNGI
jgi:hypothetical protein